MSDAVLAAANEMLGGATPKRLRRLLEQVGLGISLVTAKRWMSNGVPAVRQPTVAWALLQDLERRNARVRVLLSEVLDSAGTFDDGGRARARARASAGSRPVHGD